MLPEQIRKSCVNRAKFYCQYDEFSENNMLNRLFCMLPFVFTS